MSEKMECPVCRSYTSSITMAVANGEPCPVCGARATTIREILSIRETQADKFLKEKAERLMIELDRYKRRDRTLSASLQDIKYYLDRMEEELQEQERQNAVGAS